MQRVPRESYEKDDKMPPWRPSEVYLKVPGLPRMMKLTLGGYLRTQ